MRKVDPKNLKADWSAYAKVPTWHHITSANLAKILSVHLGTINNWKIRCVLPAPVNDKLRLSGNKNYFKISAIRSWLEGKDESSIDQEWIDNNIGGGCRSVEQAEYLIKAIGLKNLWSF